MYHTITDINKTINLQQYIDNRNGSKRIGLKFIRYNMGWYNIFSGTIRIDGKDPIRLKRGYYSFQQLADELQKENIVLSINETNGTVLLTTLARLRMHKELRNILGLNKHLVFEPNELYYGSRFVDFAIYKSLYIYLEQVSTSYNYLDGMPSSLLTVIPVENKEFGDNISVRFENPEYKYLVNGEITELKLEIRDEDNNKIKNQLPISCVLEII